jgi:hypothetical protein
MVEQPTRNVRQVTDPGSVELTGEVVPAPEHAEPFEAPLSGTQNCVVAGWEVEEWSETGDHSRWTKLADGVESVPFYLDDGTDRVLVDPGSHATQGGLLGRVEDVGEFRDSVEVDGVTVDFEHVPTVREVGAEEPTPDDVARFVAHERTLDHQTGSITNLIDVGNAHGDRRYSQATIRPGQEVYLLGTARPRDDRSGSGSGVRGGDGAGGTAADDYGTPDSTRRLRPDTAVVTPDPGRDEPFVLSTRSEDRLVSATSTGRYVLAAGLAVVLAGGLAIVASVTPAI